MQLFGCKYMCNFSVSQIFSDFFQEVKIKVGIVSLVGHPTTTANVT